MVEQQQATWCSVEDKYSVWVGCNLPTQSEMRKINYWLGEQILVDQSKLANWKQSACQWVGKTQIWEGWAHPWPLLPPPGEKKKSKFKRIRSRNCTLRWNNNIHFCVYSTFLWLENSSNSFVVYLLMLPDGLTGSSLILHRRRGLLLSSLETDTNEHLLPKDWWGDIRAS